jgi:hypothetical protein
MNIGWPEGIYLAFAALNLLAAAHIHGRPRTGEHNFPATLVGTSIVFGMLYWGGFFA